MTTDVGTNSRKARAWKWTAQRKRAALLRAQGYSWLSISRDVGLAFDTVRDLTQWPEFVARVDELSNEPIEEGLLVLKAAAREAAETVVGIMRGALPPQQHDADADSNSVPLYARVQSYEVRLAAAQDILDRLGVAVSQATEEPQPDIHITVNVEAVSLAERAYLAALRGESIVLGGNVYETPSSIEGHDVIQPLRLSSGVPDGS